MLVTCPECGAKISDSARYCPKCGKDGAGYYSIEATNEREVRYKQEEKRRNEFLAQEEVLRIYREKWTAYIGKTLGKKEYVYDFCDRCCRCEWLLVHGVRIDRFGKAEIEATCSRGDTKFFNVEKLDEWAKKRRRASRPEPEKTAKLIGIILISLLILAIVSLLCYGVGYVVYHILRSLVDFLNLPPLAPYLR